MTLALAVVAQARHFGHQGKGLGFGPGMVGLRAVLELNLTGAQQAEMLAMLDKCEAEKKNVRKDMKEARANMKALRDAKQFNEQ